MALETATYIDALVVSNPDGGDQRSTADDHLRLLKACLKRTFPNIDGEMSASQGVIHAAIRGEVTASYAQSAAFAVSAGFATSASFAHSANHAASAAFAVSASFAHSANHAASAAFAVSATNATNAVNATTATNATNASLATSAHHASSAIFATSAGQVDGIEGSAIVQTTGNQSIGGIKTFSSQIRGPDGTAAAPAFAFGGTQTDVGMFRRGTDAIGWACGGTERMWLSSAGALTCDGDVTAASDLRLKSDIRKIFGAVEKVQRLNGYTFRRKGVDERQAGVIAQEVQEVLPEVVKVDEKTGMLSVAYGNLVALLIEAVKELAERIEQ